MSQARIRFAPTRIDIERPIVGRWTRSLAVWILVVLVVCGSGIAAAPSANHHRPHNFREVVAKNFGRWDRNWDGRLSAVEVDQLVTDPHVTGESAAAVAAIHRYLRGDHAPTAVTQAELLREWPKEATRRDKDDQRPHFATDYLKFVRHLQRAPRRILSSDRRPSIEDMSQGKLGDCYFVSAVGAAVHRDPNFVRRMLRFNRDGSTDVSFAGGRQVHVRKLTDGEIALSSSAGEQGLWLNVLEKAFGRLKLQSPKAKKSNADLDLDVIARGGDARRSISLLTGHKSYKVAIRKGTGTKRPAPSDDEMPGLRRQFHNLLSRAVSEHTLACVSSPIGRVPPGLASHHVYAVLDYDSDARMVELWNPWGNKYEPKKHPPGLRNGYPTKQGRFWLPLDDLLRIFSAGQFESHDAAAEG